MNTLRRAATALAVTGLAVVGLPSAPTSAGTTGIPTHLSIAVSADSVRFGERVLVTTRLTDQLTGAPIVGEQVFLSWRETDVIHLVPRTTSATGRASVSILPFDNTAVRWSFNGGSGHAASSSASRAIQVHQYVRIHSPAETHPVQRNHRILVWGTVAPGYYGMVVQNPPPVHYAYIQWHQTDGWHRQLRVPLARQLLPNGQRAYGYVARFVPSSAMLRTVVPGNGFNAIGISRALHILYLHRID